MSSKWNSFLTAIALGVIAISLTFAVGLPLNNVQQGAIAKANTAEVLQATATHVAELKERYLVISTTIQSAPEQIVNSDSVMIPLNEAPTEQVEALVPVTIYPTPPQPASTNVPPGAATVNADIDTHRSTGTPVATVTDTPLAFPIVTETPQPEQTPDDSFAVVVTLEMIPTATFAATLTIEPPPTPAPTDAPKATVIPSPQPVVTDTVDVTPVPLPTETAAQAPTIEPSATATSGPLVSIIATPVQPTIEPSATEEATAAP